MTDLTRIVGIEPLQDAIALLLEHAPEAVSEAGRAILAQREDRKRQQEADHQAALRANHQRSLAMSGQAPNQGA